MLKVRCPSCGKSAAVPESDAGLPAVCLACGGRYTVPEMTPPADDTPPAILTDVEAGSGEAIPWRGWVAAGAAGLVLVTAIVAVLLVARDRPDPVDARTAALYKSQAEAAAAEGRLADAYAKYHELELRVGNRPVHDVHTRALVERARADKDRVYALLLDTMARHPQPATAASSPAESAAALAEPAPAEAPDPGPPGAVASGPAAPSTTDDTPSTRPAPPEAVALAPQPPSLPPANEGTAPGPSAPATQPAGPPGPVADSHQPASARPPVRPAPEVAEGVTDEQIGKAIELGVDSLLQRFDPQTHGLADANLTQADGGGRDALAVYALLQCGQTLKDERLNVRGPAMDAKLAALKRANLRAGHPQVYALALRSTALALFNRPQDRGVLRADVLALLNCHTNGAYWYTADARSQTRSAGGPNVWDNSNSQYGLLGVWSGAEAGIEVPTSYWAAVDGHWEATQIPGGQWSYSGDRRPSFTMTMAGIASLFVTHDWLDAPKSGFKVGREPFSPPLQRAINWLEAGDNAVEFQEGQTWWGYTVYGIERVGLASGFKYFGRHDWYREIAARVVAAQSNDGSWGDVIDTSYALLFLARGRHPILMNKLRFEGHWANRPRDAANLTRFAARQLERELNWQVVPLRAPAPAEGFNPGIGQVPRAKPVNPERWSEWLDSPILYLASHKPPKLLEPDYDNLRNFAEAGGLLFTHADGDDAAFNDWVERDLAPKLFPKYELKDLPPDHAVYNLVYKIEDPQARPRLRGVWNGSRLLMVHSPTDVARAWQVRDQKTKRPIFQLGVNLFLYAAGKRDLRNRLESPYVSDPGAPAQGSIAVARLEYPGNWDPEPGAWRRFARWFQRQTGSGVAVRVAPLSSQALDPRALPVAHLTGTARYDFTDADAAAVRRYVESGGVLLIDNCGGTGPFDQSVQDTLLPKAFPGTKPRPLPAVGQPLFASRGKASGTEDVSKPRLRPYTADRMGEVGTPFSVLAAGRGRVIVTPLDLTTGLLGTRTWGVAGFEPEYAQSFLKNLLFWAADGRPESPPPTPAAAAPRTTPEAAPASDATPGNAAGNASP